VEEVEEVEEEVVQEVGWCIVVIRMTGAKLPLLPGEALSIVTGACSRRRACVYVEMSVSCRCRQERGARRRERQDTRRGKRESKEENRRIKEQKDKRTENNRNPHRRGEK
jgi:hypothetical protein